jgi:hypothetical protein
VVVKSGSKREPWGAPKISYSLHYCRLLLEQKKIDFFLTYDVDQLGQFQFDLDRESIRHVDYRTNQFVVVREEIIVESFSVWITGTPYNTEKINDVAVNCIIHQYKREMF